MKGVFIMKKLISLIIAIAMALSCFSVCAFAYHRTTLNYSNVTATYVHSQIDDLSIEEANAIKTL